MKGLERMIRAARGDIEADIVLKNAKVINVFSHEIMPVDLAIIDGHFIGWGSYSAREVIDLEGRYIAPGFIDGHCHIESSMLTVKGFSESVTVRGTTSVIADPHEIANVHGIDGIRYMAKSSMGLPLNLYIMLPSCVPATSMETSGAILEAKTLVELMNEPWVIGLGEVMNYPGVIDSDPSIIEKIEAFKERVIDGHAPGLMGKELNAYITAGIRSDHESIKPEEALDKLQKGMTIMIREGSTARNLESLIHLINPSNSRRFILVTDDRHPLDILMEGHIDFALRKAISMGLDPITSIQMVTLNPAEYFGLKKIGAIAPGFRADAVVIEDLNDLSISMVFKDGKIVAKDGRMLGKIMDKDLESLPPSFFVKGVSEVDLRVKAGKGEMSVIGIVPDQIVTRHLKMKPRVFKGFAISDIERDILKIAVVERHKGTGNIGIGFVMGFGIKRGAIAQSVSHDSHNILCIGTSDKEMKRAIEEVVGMGGGQVVIEGDQVVASLSLPVGGLMSTESLEDVARKSKLIREKAKEMGCKLHDPFMVLSFLALPVIPHLKITDRGLVDVNSFQIIPLFS
jgi:adenine deaminase